MHNKVTLNWISQGIGSAKVIAQFTEADIPALTKIWETTEDSREKNLLRSTLNLLVSKGVAFLEIESVDYIGGDSWKFTKHLNVMKGNTSDQPIKQ
jgi:hypothetical protein